MANYLDAVKAGKNVLCENPFAMNVEAADEVSAATKAKGVFIMEPSGLESTLS